MEFKRGKTLCKTKMHISNSTFDQFNIKTPQGYSNAIILVKNLAKNDNQNVT